MSDRFDVLDVAFNIKLSNYHITVTGVSQPRLRLFQPLRFMRFQRRILRRPDSGKLLVNSGPRQKRVLPWFPPPRRGCADQRSSG